MKSYHVIMKAIVLAIIKIYFLIPKKQIKILDDVIDDVTEVQFLNAHSPPMRHRPSGEKMCQSFMNISEDQLHEDRLKNR